MILTLFTIKIKDICIDLKKTKVSAKPTLLWKCKVEDLTYLFLKFEQSGFSIVLLAENK